jgi:hypothetical protein
LCLARPEAIMARPAHVRVAGRDQHAVESPCRPAHGAREIKTLISGSVEQVEAGSRQVAQAGETIREVVAAVSRVTQIIGEISTGVQTQTRAWVRSTRPSASSTP